MDKPRYLKKPIGSIDSLSKALSKDKKRLISLADEADSFYYLHEKREKPDGTFREIYAAKSELKVLQKSIHERLFSNVDFPYYLQGGIKDIIIPRSHIKAVKFHKNAKLLVSMDISNFFPSLTSEVVFDIWKRFFNFPAPVAQLLTKLTTFNGTLPQGASTSQDLANLAFWDRESDVVDKLQRNGFKYTRYVDDVTVSSTTYIEMKELSPIFENIFGYDLEEQ